MKKVLGIIIFIFVFTFNCDKPLAAVISDGVYKIQSAISSNSVLDVTNGSTSNGTNIQLYTFNDSDSQKWYVKGLGNGYFSISSMLDNKKTLDVSNAGKQNGTNVQLHDSNNTNAQQWLIKDAGNGYYSIISKCNNLSLDISGGNSANGTNVQMFQSNGTNAQKFKFVEILSGKQTIEDGTYTISSALSSTRGLDVNNGSTANFTNVKLYTLSDSSWAQVWNVKYLNNGYYSLTTYLNDKKSLDVNNASATNGANIQIYDSNNSNAQQWLIKDAGNGYYNIVSKLDHFYVDVTNGRNADGANIQLYHGNGNNAQKFKFNKVEMKFLPDGLYSISPKLDSSKTVGLNSLIATNSVNVQLANSEDTNNQKWYFKNLGYGYYSIISAANSNMALDVSGAGKTSGTNVQVFQSNGTNAQQWYLKYTNGHYSLIARHSGLYLDVANGKTTVGTNIWTVTSNGMDAQLFAINETELKDKTKYYEDGYYTISSALTSDNSKVLDVSGGLKANGTKIQLFSSNNSLAQIWYLKNLKNGYYSVTSAMNPKMSLDVKDGGLTNGTMVQLHQYNGSDAQQWYFKDTGDGYVSVVSKLNGLNVDVKNGNASNGADIQVFQNNSSKSQKFKLNKYTAQKKYTGIDVSKHQNTVNWNSVSNSGLGFAIIRAGYGDNLVSQIDEQYINNINGCEKYNIPYSVYFYSYANNLGSGHQGAVNEAEHMLRLLQQVKNKPNFTGQVFYDVEDDSQTYLSTDTRTQIVDTFCSIVENAGYKCGLYSDKTKLESWFNTKFLASKYMIWVAQWPGTTSFDVAKQSNTNYSLTNPQYWQFTNSASVSGIGTRVDGNIGYDIFEAPRGLDNSFAEIEEGTYYIESKLASNMVVDLKNGDITNGTNIQLYQKNTGNGQKWYVKKIEDGYYSIASYSDNNMLMDVQNGASKAGTNIQLWEINGNDAQKWILRDLGNGYYSIISKANGLYLDVSGGSSKNGTNIQLWNGNGNASQQFKFIKDTSASSNPVKPDEEVKHTVNDGIYYIKSTDNNYLLSLNRGLTSSGNNVQLFQSNNVDTQKWKVQKLDGGYYKISTYNDNNVVLNIQNSSLSCGANVEINADSNSDSQQWIIKDAGNGTYNIVSKNGGKCLDISNGAMQNGTNIQTWINNGSEAQKFIFEDASSSVSDSHDIKSNKIIVVGDSRMELIQTNSSNINIPSNFNIIAKSGASINWVRNTALANLKAILNNADYNYNYHVVVNMGVNDLDEINVDINSRANEYLKIYTDLMINYNNVNFYLLSVNPIDETIINSHFHPNYRTTERIENFNNYLKDYVINKKNSKLKYCDSYNEINFVTVDGLHYDFTTGQNIINYIADKCIG